MVTLYQVDAFSPAPFGGNPAAVVLLPPAGEPMSDELRLKISAEMNLAETAFVETLEPGRPGCSFSADSAFRLRWFTPTTEVPLCGHATLAAAAALFQGEGNRNAELQFQTASGVLTVRRTETDGAGDAAVGQQQGAAPQTSHSQQRPLALQMRLPLAEAVDPLPVPNAPTDLSALQRLLQAAGLEGPLLEAVDSVRYTLSSNLKYLLVAMGAGFGRQQLEALSPDFAAMQRAVSGDDVRGLIVTCRGDTTAAHTAPPAAPGASKPSTDPVDSQPLSLPPPPPRQQPPQQQPQQHHFLSRFFSPWMGIPEDPVTGSAHAVLGPYWARRLSTSRLRARQCSPRGGELEVEVDFEQGSVFISGPATIVVKGQLMF